MRSVLAFLLLLGPMTFGQVPPDQAQDRVLYFNDTDSPQLRQAIANSIQAIAEISQVSVDQAHGSISVRGPAAQADLAAWLVKQLEQAGDGQNPAAYDYLEASRGDTAARVFYLEHIQVPQALQELVNLIRGIGDIQRMIPRNRDQAARAAIVIRTTPARAELAEWLVKELDIAAAETTAATHPTAARDFGEGAQGATALKICFLAQPRSQPAVAEMMQAVRAKANIQRMFPFTPAGAVALRGSPESAELAERLIHEFDTAATRP